MGGQWFDDKLEGDDRHARLAQGVTYYSDILKADGPPGASSNGFNENLALFASGHCGMWIDATVAGGMLFDKKQSQVADKVGFAPMPTGSFTGGPTWLWSLEPGDPRLLQAGDAAKAFVTWATSKEYIDLVAKENGWVSVPPGTRLSTYDNARLQEGGAVRRLRAQAIEVANPTGQTEHPRPYTGAQFVAIPEFQGIGTQVGQTVAGTLTGQMHGRRGAQDGRGRRTERTMRQAGLPEEVSQRLRTPRAAPATGAPDAWSSPRSSSCCCG